MKHLEQQWLTGLQAVADRRLAELRARGAVNELWLRMVHHAMVRDLLEAEMSGRLH